MTTTLTDRYVHAVLRQVPESRHDDLGAELRSTVGDMVDARVEAGEAPDAAERAALTELGEPVALAAQYTDVRLQLIGPRFYVVWKCLTLQLLTWVPALIAVFVAGLRVLDGESTVGEVLVDAGGAALGTAMQIVFWTTLVFAVVDRVATEVPEWSPDTLPEAPADRDYSFTDAALGVSFNLVVAVVLVAQHFRSWVEGPGGEDVAVLDPALWSGWLPFLLVVIAAVTALEVWKYLRGWTLGAVAGTVVTSVAFSAPVAWLAAEDRLLNPAFADAVDLSAGGLDNLNTAIAVGAVLVAAYEIGEAVVKGVLRGRRAG